jgi:hypothetical protein
LSSLNNRGETTGFYGDSVGTHAFLQDAPEQVISFDFPSVPLETVPGQINDFGIVSGRYAGLQGHGFLFDGKHLVSVDYPNARTGNAFAINDRGQFGGNYRNFLGDTRRAYIATPKTPGANPFAGLD